MAGSAVWRSSIKVLIHWSIPGVNVGSDSEPQSIGAEAGRAGVCLVSMLVRCEVPLWWNWDLFLLL